MRRLLRAIVVVLAIVILLAAAGAVYQAIVTSSEARAHPAPGRLVDVGGGLALHLDCTGTGAPTVILDHAGGSNSGQWALVQPGIAEVTRVCSYDRAGFGWSDTSPEPVDVGRAAEQLAQLLESAGEGGPYILVGHSYGAFVAGIFADRDPSSVAAMLLLDPGRPFGHRLTPADLDSRWRDEDAMLFAMAPIASRFGLMRLVAPSIGDLPSPEAEAYAAMNQTGRFWDSVAAVAKAMPATSTAILALPPPAVPTVVLSAGLPENDEPRRVWTLLNADIVAGVQDGRHEVIADAEHMDFALDRETAGITIATILDMVQATRSATAPPAAPVVDGAVTPAPTEPDISAPASVPPP
ncbi:MAG: alpha/beta fold hydrolase [Bauldia sp.]|nr:alpha/beta fold hydrolase [Bauldia sp.]